MKEILRQILKDRQAGRCLNIHQAVIVESEWLRLFGTGGCDCYPYTSDSDMLNDLLKHYCVKASA